MKNLGFIIILLMLTGMLLEVWKIGQPAARKWDEARRGINAVSMMNNGDYFHYYYLDHHDSFNTKPPLAVWLILLDFKIFGVSNFALRFHSVVAILFFFIFISRIILLYRNRLFLILFLGMIISVNGIIGFHVGRTGDTDSLLLFFLTAFLYYFLKYWDPGKNYAIYPAAIFLALAFYTKSVAIFLILPAVLSYMLIYPKRSKILNKDFLFSGILFILIVLSLAILPDYISSFSGSAESLWKESFATDLYKRFIDNSFEQGYDPFYIFHALDMNFSVWIYIFYVGGIYGIYRLIIKKDHLSGLKYNRLIIISILIVLSYSILLTMSMNKHRWYIAPAIPFFAILTVEFLLKIWKNIWVKAGYALILLTLVALKFKDYNNPDKRVVNFFKNHSLEISNSENVYVDRAVPQDLSWEFLKWNYKKAKLFPENLPDENSSYIYFGPLKKDVPGSEIARFEQYHLIKNEN